MGAWRFWGAALGCVILCASSVAARAADTVKTGQLAAADTVEWPFYIGLHKVFTEAGFKPDVVYVPSPGRFHTTGMMIE